MKLAVIPKMFTFRDWIEFTPEDREQRVLNKDRIPDIGRYILDNEDGYLFSSITASYRCDVHFEPVNTDGHGFLEMDFQDANFVINDGQHRCAAIAHAVKANPAIGEESISVLLFPYESKGRVQQMFSDLNRYVQKTPRPLNILFDQRDGHARVTLEVCEKVPTFQNLVDKENLSLPARSEKAFTLAALYDATQELLEERMKGENGGFHELVEAAVDFWTAVSEFMPDWQKIKNREVRPIELRQQNISTHSVVLRALGGVGAELVKQYPSDWREHLADLASINWSKKNRDWENVCMVANSVVANRQARLATKAYLKRKLGLRVSESEQKSIQYLSPVHDSRADFEGEGNSAVHKREGKMDFIKRLLLAEDGNRMTISAVANALVERYPETSLETAMNSVRWNASTGLKRDGKVSNHLPEGGAGKAAVLNQRRQTIRPTELRIGLQVVKVNVSNLIPVAVANWILKQGKTLIRIQNFVHETNSGFPGASQTKELDNGWFIEVGDSQEVLLQKGRRLLDAHGFHDIQLTMVLEDGNIKKA
jgi:DNA sulfur modification protein DndB